MSQIRDFYGDGLRAQRAILGFIEDDQPPSDQVVTERALLLTLEHPTDQELDLAYGFWRMNRGGRVAKRSQVGALIGTNSSRTPPTRPFRALWLRWWDSIAEERSGLRTRVLEGIGTPENIERARALLEAEIDAGALREILVVPRMWWDGQEVKTDLFYLCPTMESRFYLALVKLLGSKSTAESLRVCALEYCGRIFVSQPPPGGGPRPKYCTPEHRERAIQLTGAERTERWRKKQARKPK